jgi:membrane protein CcdC involved in cytochrome C biogenesis
LDSTILITIIIIAVMMFFILRKQLREKEVKPRKLIIVPVIMLLVTAGTIYQTMFSGIFGFMLVLGGFLIGALVGYFMGTLFKMRVTDEGVVMMKGSIITISVWIILIVVKIYSESVLGGGNTHINNITSMFLAMTMGTMIVRRFVIYKKYNEHKKVVNNL